MSQQRQLGQQPPCPPALSAATIVALEPPPSSSIIAAAFLSSGCNRTMRTLAGEEGDAPALAPASPTESEPASAAAGGGGTRSSLRSLRGGRTIPPPPLAANPRTSRRRQRRRWGRRQHGGRWGGRSCHCCLAFLVARVVAQQLGGWTNWCAKKTWAKLPFPNNDSEMKKYRKTRCLRKYNVQFSESEYCRGRAGAGLPLVYDSYVLRVR